MFSPELIKPPEPGRTEGDNRLESGRSLDTPEQSLEKQAPGSLDYLRFTLGLKNLQRYPVPVLARMYAERDEPGEWGVMVYPKHNPDSAFNHKPQIAELATTLEEKFKLRIVECESADEATSMLNGMRERYGSAAFAVLCGHGNSESIQLGDGEGEASISKENLTGDLGGSLSELLSPGAEICLASCSTGVDQGIAEDISTVADRTTHAPDSSTNTLSFGAVATSSGVSFHPKYRDATANKVEPKNDVPLYREP